jgi:hypothetical protein
MSGDHAPFAPSSMNRTVACAGCYNLLAVSRAMGMSLNEDDTPSSLEGTAAHWVASEALCGRWAVPGSLAPNGVAVTDEMIDAAETYVDAVAPYRDGAMIEQVIHCPAIHSDCYGTPDFARLQDGTLFISDYKYGHKYVDAFENWQLLTYAAGHMALRWHGEGELQVVLQVVQPSSFHRDGPVREWWLTGTELLGYIETLRAACIAALLPDAVCTVSEACYMCPVRHICEASLHAELSAFELSGSTVPLYLTPDAKSLRLRQIRRAMEHLKQMESGISEDVFQMIRDGQNVPGFALAASAGRVKWKVSVEEIVALGAALGADISKPGAITPTQALKKLPADIVAQYSERPAGAIALVESDAGTLRRIFGGV